MARRSHLKYLRDSLNKHVFVPGIKWLTNSKEIKRATKRQQKQRAFQESKCRFGPWNEPIIYVLFESFRLRLVYDYKYFFTIALQWETTCVFVLFYALLIVNSVC